MSETLLAPLEWHNEKRIVKDLVPYEYNPRIITEEKLERLKASLEKFNLAEVPAINTDNVIIAGHQRIKVLMALGRGGEEIDVRVPNRTLTEGEYKQYNIVSNVSTGYWDKDILEEVFSDIDLGALGLDIDDIVLPPDIIPEEFRSEDEEHFEPDVPVEPISVLGDHYELRSLDKNIVHKLLCGDSTDPESFKRLLGNERIDCMVTDPPYNVDYTGGHKKERTGIQNDNMKSVDFYAFLFEFFNHSNAYLKPGGPFYIFHADIETVNFRNAISNNDLYVAQCLIWAKNNFMLGRSDYHWKHEPCLYGWKKGAAHQWNSDRRQSTILEFDKPLVSEEHPTMKPLDLIGYLVCNSSFKGNIVFDGFGGSGSTLIACEKNWRNTRMIEFDPKYADVIVNRWLKYMQDNRRKFEILKNGKRMAKEELEAYKPEV